MIYCSYRLYFITEYRDNFQDTVEWNMYMKTLYIDSVTEEKMLEMYQCLLDSVVPRSHWLYTTLVSELKKLIQSLFQNKQKKLRIPTDSQLASAELPLSNYFTMYYLNVDDTDNTMGLMLRVYLCTEDEYLCTIEKFGSWSPGNVRYPQVDILRVVICT